MEPMVLCYNIQPEKLAKMRVLCLRLGIGVRVVAVEDIARPVGALAGVPVSAETEAAAPFYDEMLVMAHFKPGMLDAFLNGFRQSRIAPVALKAMLTPTNASWSAARLHEAIAEEHAQMQAMKRAKR